MPYFDSLVTFYFLEFRHFPCICQYIWDYWWLHFRLVTLFHQYDDKAISSLLSIDIDRRFLISFIYFIVALNNISFSLRFISRYIWLYEYFIFDISGLKFEAFSDFHYLIDTVLYFHLFKHFHIIIYFSFIFRAERFFEFHDFILVDKFSRTTTVFALRIFLQWYNDCVISSLYY